MTDVFGLLAGVPKSCVGLLEGLLEVRFSRHAMEGSGNDWYIAESKDGQECLVLLPNATADGDRIEPRMSEYQVLFYIVRSPRDDAVKRVLATTTRFRFLFGTEHLREVVEREVAARSDSVSRSS